MFNKSHYVFLAKSMKDSKPTGIMDQHVWLRNVHTLAHDLGENNPYFDKNRFFRSCGVTHDNTEDKK